MIRRLLLLLLLAVGGLTALSSPTAFAHNSLESSVPEDGETLASAPSTITMTFAKDVPLETLTVTLTDPTGARTEIPGSVHGASAKEVVTTLPPLTAGEHSVRWRLVSADGHAITGRIGFTVQQAAAPPSTTAPSTAPGPAPSTTLPATVDGTAPGDWSSPSWLGWLLRYGGYLAIMVLGGIAAVEALVWRDLASSPRARVWSLRAVVAIAATALAQLAVLAGDIAGEPPWSALGDLGTAAETSAGVALVVRIALAVAVWLLVVRERPSSPDLYADVVAILSIGLLATWSFTGHARSMRWPWLGVPMDVVHHGAAAAWVGGLLVLGTLVLRRRDPDLSGVTLARFSRLAGAAVAAIVVTGVFQAIRLVGGLGPLFGTTHGRLLVAKVVLLAVMLWIANHNRRALVAHPDGRGFEGADIGVLRTMVRREAVLGVVVLGVTAWMVASLPGVAT